MNARAKAPALQILFPGPEAWELWIVDADETAQCRSVGEPVFEAGPGRRVLALPVACTYAIPLWVFGQNEEELRGAAQLHLEKDGLSRPEEAAHFDVEPLVDQDNRVLIRIDALSAAELLLGADSPPPDLICLSPRMLPLPASQVVVWRELGQFVVAMTRMDRLLYHNVVTTQQFDAKAADEVARWARQFQFQGIAGPICGLTLWTEDAQGGEIEARTGLPLVREPRPSPRFLSGSASGIVPRSVQELRRRESRRLRLRRALIAGGALAGMAALGCLALAALAVKEHRQLLQRIETLSPAASEFEQIQRRWNEVAHAVDPDQSPLEAMLLIHRLPSGTQVKILRFEQTRDRLALKGRATSPSEALKFLGALSNCAQLSAYQWTYTQPVIAQDSSASFEIEGILAAEIR